MTEDDAIPPVRGLAARGGFASTSDMVKYVAQTVAARAIERGVLRKGFKPDPKDIAWVTELSPETIYSVEWQEAWLSVIMNTQSFALVECNSMSAGAAKLLADEKNLPRLHDLDGQYVQPKGQNGELLVDAYGKPLDCKASNDFAHNKMRVEQGGVGMFVRVVKFENMREFGDMTDKVFATSAFGPAICKCYTGVVSSIDDEGYEVNLFETVGGRGYDGISRQRWHFYASVAAEGDDWPANAYKNAAPGRSPKVLFTRGFGSKANSLLNLVSVHKPFSEIMALGRGRFTNESLVRFIDMMRESSPWRVGDHLTSVRAAEAAAYRARGQPRPFKYFRFLNGYLEALDSRRARQDPRAPADDVVVKPHDTFRRESICQLWNSGGCERKHSCPWQDLHICLKCGGTHREFECTAKRTLMRSEELDRSKRSREGEMGRVRVAHDQATTNMPPRRNGTDNRFVPFVPESTNFAGVRLTETETSRSRPRNVAGLASVRSGNTRAGEYNQELERVDRNLANTQMRGQKRSGSYDRRSPDPQPEPKRAKGDRWRPAQSDSARRGHRNDWDERDPPRRQNERPAIDFRDRGRADFEQFSRTYK